MQHTHDTRLSDLIGDLAELSTALGDLHFRWAVTEETLALCEQFEHELRFERLTNNLRDGWRLDVAAGLHACVSSPATAEEVLAAAPFARLLTEADNLHAAVMLGNDGDGLHPGTDNDTGVAELTSTLAATVAALAELIADLTAGRVTLPPFLEGDALAAADDEAEALTAGPSDEELDAVGAAAAGDA
jgi:hypothetical protein